MFLTHEQLIDLTGKVQHAAQARALLAMGISFLCRPDGSIVVLIEQIKNSLDCKNRTQVKQPTQPDFDAVR